MCSSVLQVTSSFKQKQIRFEGTWKHGELRCREVPRQVPHQLYEVQFNQLNDAEDKTRLAMAECASFSIWKRECRCKAGNNCGGNIAAGVWQSRGLPDHSRRISMQAVTNQSRGFVVMRSALPRVNFFPVSASSSLLPLPHHHIHRHTLFVYHSTAVQHWPHVIPFNHKPHQSQWARTSSKMVCFLFPTRHACLANWSGECRMSLEALSICQVAHAPAALAREDA